MLGARRVEWGGGCAQSEKALGRFSLGILGVTVVLSSQSAEFPEGKPGLPFLRFALRKGGCVPAQGVTTWSQTLRI